MKWFHRASDWAGFQNRSKSSDSRLETAKAERSAASRLLLWVALLLTVTVPGVLVLLRLNLISADRLSANLLSANRLSANLLSATRRSAALAAGESEGQQPSWREPVLALEPALADHLAIASYPNIQPQARLARVPIIMYHDVLPNKEVFFDITPTELEGDFQRIRQQGLTPISLDQLVQHLQTGQPLPPKPIVLTFDDGYAGHFTYVYPLLKKYSYPAAFAIYPGKVGRSFGRSSLTWEQLRQMAADPLVTIAAHSVTHPSDLRRLPDAELRFEIVESKRILETELGITIDHFVYPEGNYDDRVAQWVQKSGYRSAYTMNVIDRYAGESKNLLSIERIGFSSLDKMAADADGGSPLLAWGQAFNFAAPVQFYRRTIEDVPLFLATGGRPATIHENRRYRVGEIIKKTKAIAAVDGTFFSLESIESNAVIGPVLAQNSKKFTPGNPNDVKRIKHRPLVLIGPDGVKFVPFDPDKHNSLSGIRAELANVTDAFVAAAWLVKDGQPQPTASFNLDGHEIARDRAFWGIDQAGRPILGITDDFLVDSVTLGQVLSRAGMRDIVMLDSGASTDLVFRGKSYISFEPRPVPHVVTLMPPNSDSMPDSKPDSKPDSNP